MNDSDTDTPSGSPAAAAEPTLDEDVRMLRALASLLGFFAWNSRYVKFCDGLAQRLATERAAAQRDARRCTDCGGALADRCMICLEKQLAKLREQLSAAPPVEVNDATHTDPHHPLTRDLS